MGLNQRLRALDQRVLGRMLLNPRRRRRILLLVGAFTALAALINLAIAIIEPGFLSILLTATFACMTVVILSNARQLRKLDQAGPSPGSS